MIWHPSPNFGTRRGGLRPELVVLHFTAMRDAPAALARLCDPAAQVSAHYLIGRDGTLWQLVDEAARAWHAGAGSWRGMADVNSRSIGIELDNSGAQPFAEPQMARLEALLAAVLVRWNIPPRGVIGHACMAPERKDDPGPRFDWARLARQGLALAPQGGVAVPDGLSFPQLLDRIGYPPADADKRLAAFRARFRPAAARAACEADATDRRLAAAVLSSGG